MEIVRRGKCINFGNDCAKADRKEIIELGVTEDFVCPDCGSDLVEEAQKTPPPIKKIVIAIIAAALLGGGGFAIYKIFIDKPSVTVTIDPSTVTIQIGETQKLSAKSDPENATKGVKWAWTSSNESIATVSNNGVVTGKAEGSATITATYKKSKGSASISVITQPQPTPVEFVSLNRTTLTLEVGKNETLTVTVQPDNVSQNVEWSSDKPSVATVSPTGVVTAVAEGTANITVTAAGEETAVCVVTVNNGRTLPPSPSCGTYTGESRNGLPHGLGTFTYNSRVLIDDHKMVYAERGDYITGTFREGKIVSVQLYNSGGNLKQTVIPQQPASICR